MTIWKRLRGSGDLLAIGTFAVMAIAFYVFPTLEGKDIELSSVYSVLQTFGAYGLLALGLGIGMIAAQFDLSILGTFALGGMIAVKAGGDVPALGVLVAAGCGVVAGVVQGALVARFKLNSMSVTLGGFLILVGLTGAIGKDETAAYPNVEVGIDLDRPILEIFSLHSLIVIGFFVIVGLTLRYTRIGRDLRAVGGSERGSRVAGVSVGTTLIGVYATAGALAGIAGALNAYSLGSVQPNPGFSPLVFGATAALLGGVAFAGGKGTALGIALGALALSLLQATFGILASPEWVSSVVTGALLAIAAIVAAPRLRDHYRAIRARMATRQSSVDQGSRISG